LLLIAGAYLLTNLSRTWLFWLAFILTRPLGAAVGDILTKPVADGGLNLSRISSSLAIALFMIGAIPLTMRSARRRAALPRMMYDR
jgi:uncharacterized membrane-anchored protein